MNKHEKALELDKIIAKLVDRTQSAPGREKASAVEPVHDLPQANRLLTFTSEAHALLARYQCPSFGSLRDTAGALARAGAGGVLSTTELLRVAENLRVIRALDAWRKNQDDEKKLSLDAYFSALMPNRYLEERITTAILSEEEISDRASQALFDIRRKMRQAGARVREKLDQIVRSQTYQKYLQDTIITQRGGRYVVPVKAEFRSMVPGLVHDASSSGATVFIEPMAVVEANNEINMLKSKEAEEIERILYELSGEAASYADEIRLSVDCAAELDVIFAKAQLAYDMRAGVPALGGDGVTVLNKARHPLLDPDKVVPVSLTLGESFDTLIITGPNTGGKTVSIKTVGLLTLMAMCGLMIPAADGSRVCVYDKVFADIGDEQSIEQSLSTFSAHMTNIVDILRQCGPGSLVLIDELGAGTDPVEGAALATAILEKLREKGCQTACTTHYAELKAYALATPGIENGSCEFDVSTLRPTYRLLIGVPGRSNAFAISRRLGMYEAVVDRAKELVSGENTRFEDVVGSLEASRLSMEREQAEAGRVRAEAENILADAKARQETLERERERILEQARGEALRIVERSRREAQTLLAEVEETRKALKRQGQNRDELTDLRAKLRRGIDDVSAAAQSQAQQADDDYVLPRPLRVGDTVSVKGMGGLATVTSVGKNGKIEVQSGSAKMKLTEADVRLEDAPKKEKIVQPRTQNRVTGGSARSSRNECDLRGMTVEEALMALELFLDSMVMAHMDTFTVIHGKGTGVLRKAVQKYLSSNKFVKSHRLGRYGEGEDGVTIVTLK